MQKNPTLLSLQLKGYTITVNAQVDQWDPELYEKNSSTQFKLAMEALKKIPLSGKKDILDIGCGDGKITAYMAQKMVSDGTVVGTDQSHEMISHASETFKAISNLSFVHSDATTLPFENQFDLATSFWCLHWIEDLLTAFKKIEHALKPGGKTLLYFIVNPTNEKYHPIIRGIQNTMKKTTWQQYCKDHTIPLHIPTVEKLLNAINATNMSIDYLDIKKNYDVFENKEEFIKTLSAIPFASCIPKELQHGFYSEVIDEYQKDLPQINGGKFYQCGHGITLILEKQL